MLRFRASPSAFLRSDSICVQPRADGMSVRAKPTRERSRCWGADPERNAPRAADPAHVPCKSPGATRGGSATARFCLAQPLRAVTERRLSERRQGSGVLAHTGPAPRLRLATQLSFQGHDRPPLRGKARRSRGESGEMAIRAPFERLLRLNLPRAYAGGTNRAARAAARSSSRAQLKLAGKDCRHRKPGAGSPRAPSRPAQAMESAHARGTAGEAATQQQLVEPEQLEGAILACAERGAVAETARQDFRRTVLDILHSGGSLLEQRTTPTKDVGSDALRELQRVYERLRRGEDEWGCQHHGNAAAAHANECPWCNFARDDIQPVPSSQWAQWTPAAREPAAQHRSGRSGRLRRASRQHSRRMQCATWQHSGCCGLQRSSCSYVLWLHAR
eukprot:COSAG06_NODE_3211_length_5642_cov_5.269824_8_plen_389_part_00